MLKIVLFPQPDGPIRLTNWPGATESVTWASAWNEPAGVAKAMLTSSIRSLAGETMRISIRDRRDAGACPLPAESVHAPALSSAHVLIGEPVSIPDHVRDKLSPGHARWRSANTVPGRKP